MDPTTVREKRPESVRERLERRKKDCAGADGAEVPSWKRQLYIDTKLDHAAARKQSHIKEVRSQAAKLAKWHKDVRAMLYDPDGARAALSVAGGGGGGGGGSGTGSPPSSPDSTDKFTRLAAATSPPSAEELRLKLEGADKKRRELLYRRAHASALHNVTTRVRTCIHRRKRARRLADVKKNLDESLRAAAARREEAMEGVRKRAHEHVVRAGDRARKVRAGRKIVRWARSTRAGDEEGRVLDRSLDAGRVASRVGRLYRTRAMQQALSTVSNTVVSDADALRASFESCAAAIQRRELVAAGQTLLQGVTRARDILEPAMRPSSISGCTKSSFRPLVARSSRTFLAALMIAHFPEEILENWKNGSSVVSAETDLVDHAHRVIDAVSKLLAASGEGSAIVDLDLAEAILAFNTTWCEYMDTFMVWKHGDGMRLAQALAGPFRELCATEFRYDAEFATPIGREDEGLEQLRKGLAGQFVQIRKQLVALLGDKKAAAWERDQRTAVRKRMDRLATAAKIASQKDPKPAASSKRVRSPSSSPTSAATYGAATLEGAGESKSDSSHYETSPATSPMDSTQTSPATSPTRSPRSPPNVAASPGKMRLMKQVFSNAALAHQILLHPDTRLPDPDMPLEAAAFLDLRRRSGGGGGGGGGGGSGGEPDSVATMPSLSLGDPAEAGTEAPSKHEPRERSCSMRDTESSVDRTDKPVIAVTQPFTGTAEDVARAVVVELRAIVAGLVECVPHRRDMHARIRDRLDEEVHFNSISKGHMTWTNWLELLQYLASIVGELEAPGRVEDSRAWVSSTTSTLMAQATRYAHSMDRETTNALPMGLREYLPGIFAWVHFKLKQIRVDVANFHISTLGPYLRRNGIGADFERKRFSEALARGDTSLSHTATWLADSASRLTTKLKQVAPSVVDTLPAALKRDDAQTRMSLIREGLIALIARPRALVHDVSAGEATGRAPGALVDPVGPVDPNTAFPETFVMDVKQLTEMQSELQRVSLVLSLTALVQQAVSVAKPATTETGSQHSTPSSSSSSSSSSSPSSSLTSLPADLYTILQDEDDVEVGNLEAAAVSVAHNVAASVRKTISEAGVATLRKAVGDAISVDHRVYAIFQNRVLGYVRGAMGAALRGMRYSDADRVQPVPAWEAALCPVPKAPLHPTVMKAVSKMGVDLARMARHSENVFGSSHYASLCSGLAL